jgi:uncharacterized LabA/DUF88 family protein
MTQERVCIFIDSGNFYHLVLKKLGIHDVDFDFEKFAVLLAKGREIAKEGKRFYVATVRDKNDQYENKDIMAKQAILLTRLSKAGNWAIKHSTLKTRIETIKIDGRVKDYQNIVKRGIKEIVYERSREKGIDVKIAVDLIVGAIDNKYDTAILVSSDTDLVPALDLIRYRLKKKVEYIGFSIPKDENRNIYAETKPIPRMIGKTDILRGLVESDIEPFIIENLFTKPNRF